MIDQQYNACLRAAWIFDDSGAAAAVLSTYRTEKVKQCKKHRKAKAKSLIDTFGRPTEQADNHDSRVMHSHVITERHKLWHRKQLMDNSMTV